MCPPSDRLRPATKDVLLSSTVPSCIPTDAISQAAYQHASQQLHPIILNHSIRTFLHARQISSQENLSWSTDLHLQTLLFVACIFHDIGTSESYNTGPTRFEIEGADAAVKFLEQHPEQFTKDERHDVWIAIAIHDTPQIAERIGTLARLVRLGVVIDFKRPSALAMVEGSWVKEVEAEFQRGEIEKALGDAVVEQAIRCPEKAPPACWPGGLYRAKLADPDWEGVNKAF